MGNLLVSCCWRTSYHPQLRSEVFIFIFEFWVHRWMSVGVRVLPVPLLLADCPYVHGVWWRQNVFAHHPSLRFPVSVTYFRCSQLVVALSLLAEHMASHAGQTLPWGLPQNPSHPRILQREGSTVRAVERGRQTTFSFICSQWQEVQNGTFSPTITKLWQREGKQ